jgi:hypothetical protein
VDVKSIKLDGESIHVFDSAIYLFESSSGYTLELMMIVSEVVLRKYKNAENIIVEIELDDGRLINSIMHLQSLSGGLPQFHLFCAIDDFDDYQDFYLVKEIDPVFPRIGEGLTLQDIRQYEMPNERVKFNLNLPIDQAEWIAKQTKKDLEKIFKEFIYEYWRTKEK